MYFSHNSKVYTMTDKVLHTVQLAMILLTAVLLIVFAHAYISPEIVFTSLVAGIGGIVGSRIASNGYSSDTEKKP